MARNLTDVHAWRNSESQTDEAAARNAEEARRLNAALSGAGVSKASEREILRALWAISGGQAQFRCFNGQVAAAAGKSERFVERRLPAVMETQKRMGLYLIERTAKGSKNMHTGEARPSEYDASGMRAIVAALDRERPVNIEACMVIGARVAHEMRTPPAAPDEDDEPVEIPSSEARRLPTMACSIRTIERAIEDLIARAEADGADELPHLGYVSRLVESIHEERQAAHLAAFDSALVATNFGGPQESPNDDEPVGTAKVAEATSEDREGENAIAVPVSARELPPPFTVKEPSKARPSKKQRDPDAELVRVLAVLEGGKKSGRGYRARCPAHADAHASLTVSTGEAVPVVWHCKAGCTQEAVGAAINARLGGVAVEPRPEADRSRRPKASGPLASLVARYVYRDESGEPLYRVTRRSDKTFAQEAYSNGRWTSGLGDVRRVPYLLPDLLAAYPARTVFVVEGEKDADRLAALDLIATTSGGVMSWRAEYAEHFRGRSVVILPDNDPAGLQYAETVRRSLAPVASSVRVLELPGLAEKDDVSDWLDAGHTADELEALAHFSVADPIPCDVCGNFHCSC